MIDSNQIQPLEDRLVIQRDREEVVTKSGLLLPTLEDRGYPVKGIVTRTGVGSTEKGVLTPVDVSVGDEIYYVEAHAVEVGDELSIVSESSVIATVRGSGEVVPHWDKVLIELKTDGGNTASGITLLSDTGEAFDRGVVVAVGPGLPTQGHRTGMELHVGDAVAFNQFSGVELDLGVDDMRRLFVTRESEVHGVWQV